MKEDISSFRDNVFTQTDRKAFFEYLMEFQIIYMITFNLLNEHIKQIWNICILGIITRNITAF